MAKESLTEEHQYMEPGLRWIVLTILCVAAFFTAFMIQAINVALPTIGREFGANAAVLGWIVTAYVLSVAAFSLPFGSIGDIVGLKKMILIGTFIYAIMSAISAVSVSSIMLIICRAIQGVSAAMILVNMVAFVSVIYPPNERGKALGINVTGVYAGSSLGPFLGGILTGFWGWRSLFVISLLISLTVGVLLLWKVKGEWGSNQKRKIDTVGWIIYVVSIVAWMYGFSILPESVGIVLVIAGTVGLAIFFKWEGKISYPLINLKILKNNRYFIQSILSAFFNYTSVFAIAFLLSLYLQYIKAFSPEMTGLIMITHPIFQAVVSPIAGRVSDRINAGLVASVGMALTFIGLVSFVFLSNSTPLWIIIIALALIGVGFAFFLSPNTNAVMSSVPTNAYGVASASMSTMISVGQMMSMGITMVITAIILGNVAITPTVYPELLISMRIGFIAFSVLSFCGILVSFFRGKPKTF